MVRFEVDGRVALITLDRPEARNAINGQVATELGAAVQRLEDDGELRVGILRANTEGQSRPVFCAGADLKAINNNEAAAISPRGSGFASLIYRARTKPIIAAIDGLATAGGCEIALSCDLIVCSNRSSFGLAEVRRNLVAAGGGLHRLPRAIGRFVAMEAILTGEPFTAQRAFELGMVNRVVEPDQVEATAMALAEQICLAGPLAVAASREIVLQSDDLDEPALRAKADAAMAAMMQSEDIKEGLTAFIEKRAPNWQGR